MNSFIVFATLLAAANAGHVYLGGASPVVYSGLGHPGLVAAPVAVAPAVTSSQYHAQDELGQYSYGYAGGPSSKAEVRTADGITRGGFSYVDANGLVQNRQYISDPVNGFRVAASDLPVPAPVPLAAGPVHIASLPIPVDDTPEVKAAKIEHFAAHNAAALRAAL